ncbi:MAG: shikimate kinase [Oscillospiraceae bacterium]|jgi:shikimate kinase|nr:shikimate kinase [Oscillospiraceae bacterium]
MKKSKSIYLCGFMGSGKSSAGKIAAEKIGTPFLDLDSYIVEKEKRTIPEIFAESGEGYFRELEIAAISRMTDGYIIALGGGAMINRKNAAMINEYGVSVFIDAEFETCYGRIKNDPNRPLAFKSSKKTLEKLYADRKKSYVNNAVRTVNGNTDVVSLAERIIAIYREVNGAE